MTALELLQKALPFVPAGDLHNMIVEVIAKRDLGNSLFNRLRLTPSEQAMMACLLDNQGRPVSVNVLQAYAEIRTLDSLFVHKFRLNQKLERAKIGVITCRRGTGYTLELTEDGA